METKNWDNENFMGVETAQAIGDRRYRYTPFHRLSAADQSRARNRYPYKSEGHWGGFLDEHYYYPVNRKGELGNARRVLAIPHAMLVDSYMGTLGYKRTS